MFIYHIKGQSSTEFFDDHICYGDTHYTIPAIIVCPGSTPLPFKWHQSKEMVRKSSGT